MLPFREITLEDKPMVEHCGSHYNYHLCERCFVDLFMWRSHYNTQICFKDGFMLVKMSPLEADTTAILRLSVRATSALRWMRSSRMPLNAVFRSSSSRSLSR